MNKYLLIIFVILQWFTYLHSQNLQLHYETAEDRKYYTATLEIFWKYSIGFTYMFADFYYKAVNNGDASLLYGEISRYFNFPSKDLMTTVQFNGGAHIFHNREIVIEPLESLRVLLLDFYSLNDFLKFLIR